jgi:hypothetical protein
LKLTKNQAKKLEVKPNTQLSPHLEKCCLLLSANVSYQNTARDLEILTGLKVCHSTQQRLVQRYKFTEVRVKQEVEELSVDGGKVRLRTPKGLGCEWRDYKAVNLHTQAVAAYFQDNQSLLAWVNQQELSEIVTCLGDGHDGIWNLIAAIATKESRLEILDWYHLVENLYKVGGDQALLAKVEAFLWRGNVAAAIAEFDDWSSPQVENFIAYLHKHQSRIPDYWYFQSEQISSIGSGAIESTVKQIGRRVKISGAQWNKHNVPQVLFHRTAYLNGMLSTTGYLQR